MIITLSYRGLFRQADYETVTVEATLTLDTADDCPADTSSIPAVRDYMTAALDTLVQPWISRAAELTEFTDDQTSVHAWKETVDAAASTPAQRKQRR